jgi:photosystem II stability/assembly factor-like uncharacterized protein
MDAVDFLDARTGWVAGQQGGGHGVLLHTADGGATWSTAPLDAPASDLQTLLNLDPGAVAMAFADARHGWIISRDGTMLRTTDGGASWSRP